MLRKIAGMGYNPYEGNDIADFTPQQKAAMASTNAAAGAFGMPQADYGGPTGATEGANGIFGFSTHDVMKQQTPEYDSLMKDVNKIFKNFAKPARSGGGGGGSRDRRQEALQQFSQYRSEGTK